MKKRILAVLLAALMTLTAIPVFADSGWKMDQYQQYGCWLYHDSGEQVEIVRYYTDDPETNLVFPSEINNKPVTKLSGGLGFLGMQLESVFPALGGFYIIPPEHGVEEVTLPDSITHLLYYSFYDCTSLKKITLGKNVVTIGTGVFQGCTSLEKIDLPGGITDLGEYAFADCTSLKSIDIPARVWYIWNSAFEGCTSMESVTIPAAMQYIGAAAFKSCSSLKTVYYAGTREQWNNITIYGQNGPLTSATIYYEHPAHAMEYVPAAPTCTESGAAAHYHCTICGKDFLDEAGETEFDASTVPALGHVPGEWTLTAAPTCTETGVETRLCARCGDALSETRPIAALGHDYRPVSTTSPTCTENGFTTFVCSRCGDSYNSDGQSAPGHLYGDWTVTTAPSCTASGVETRYCQRCDAVETRALEPTGHDFGDWTETTAPTCTEEGEKIRYCAVCGAPETGAIAPKGHSYGAWEYPTWETCTTDGEEKRVCTVCGNVETLVRPATGHSFRNGYCRICWAEDTSAAKISVSPATAGKGRQVELTVSMTRNPGVSSLVVGLDYDSSAMRLDSVTNGNLFGEIAEFDPDDGGGLGTVVFDSASNVMGDGVLMKLTFTVMDDACMGWNDVGAFVRFACDENGDDADILWFEGSVFVFMYGDANGDGEITGRDASLILQYVANYDDSTGESSVDLISFAADVNGDGEITGKDAMLILQYAANYDEDTGTSTVVLGPAP